MKKRLLLAIIAIVSLPASAQMSETPMLRSSVATASFWGNWFVQVDFAGTSFYGDRGNTPGMSLPSGMFKDFRTSKGFSLALGKWYTPDLGLRTKLNGLWGRTVVSEDRSLNASKYWTLSEQLLFNFSNLFAGYSETRLWNLIPYLSGSLGRNMTHNTYAMGLGVGLLNQWRVSPKLAFNLDLSWNYYEPDFDGAGGAVFSKGLPGKDRLINFEVGITYSLGRGTFKRVPDVESVKVLYESQINALNGQLADECIENDRLRRILREKTSF